MNVKAKCVCGTWTIIPGDCMNCGRRVTRPSTPRERRRYRRHERRFLRGLTRGLTRIRWE